MWISTGLTLLVLMLRPPPQAVCLKGLNRFSFVLFRRREAGLSVLSVKTECELFCVAEKLEWGVEPEAGVGKGCGLAQPSPPLPLSQAAVL